MGTSIAGYERRDRLAHILDMLNALSGMVAQDGSNMLRYFVELAVAQARDDYNAAAGRYVIDCDVAGLISFH